MSVDDIDLLYAKVEAAYGTDAVPTLATDMLVTYDWAPQPVISDNFRRKIETGFAGRRPSLPTRQRQGHSFKMELSGSAPRTSPPAGAP